MIAYSFPWRAATKGETPNDVRRHHKEKTENRAKKRAVSDGKKKNTGTYFEVCRHNKKNEARKEDEILCGFLAASSENGDSPGTRAS